MAAKKKCICTYMPPQDDVPSLTAMRTLSLGKSIFVKLGSVSLVTLYNRYNATSSQTNNYRFAARIQRGGLRIWRIE